MITNYPAEKSSIFYPHVYWDGYFTNEELELIVQYCENKKLEEGKIFGEDKSQKQLRVSKINFTEPDEENRWIFNKLNTFVKFINDKFYGFELIGYNAFQFSTYNSKEQGHYDWHIDSYLNSQNQNGSGLHRKLSMTLLLNDDFEGGDFEMNMAIPKKIDVIKGRAIFFPSFLLHRVAPVTKGVRKSLVIWVEGPRWK
jgi:PKHD-type hydroxylase